MSSVGAGAWAEMSGGPPHPPRRRRSGPRWEGKRRCRQTSSTASNRGGRAAARERGEGEEEARDAHVAQGTHHSPPLLVESVTPPSSVAYPPANRHAPCPTQQTHAIGVWVRRNTAWCPPSSAKYPLGSASLNSERRSRFCSAHAPSAGPRAACNEGWEAVGWAQETPAGVGSWPGAGAHRHVRAHPLVRGAHEPACRHAHAQAPHGSQRVPHPQPQQPPRHLRLLPALRAILAPVRPRLRPGSRVCADEPRRAEKLQGAARGRAYSDAKVANRDTKVWHLVIENGY